MSLDIYGLYPCLCCIYICMYIYISIYIYRSIYVYVDIYYIWESERERNRKKERRKKERKKERKKRKKEKKEIEREELTDTSPITGTPPLDIAGGARGPSFARTASLLWRPGSWGFLHSSLFERELCKKLGKSNIFLLVVFLSSIFLLLEKN